MDFKRFKDSGFINLGHCRFDYQTSTYFLYKINVLFETSISLRFEQHEINNFNQLENKPSGFDKSQALVHLKKALLINDPLFLDIEFKKEIARQWLETSTIIEKLDKKPRWSILLITEPGIVVSKHTHKFQQTLTFCYKFDDERADVFEDSCFILGPNGERQVNFTDDNKFYFTFLDYLPHEVRSNEWRFFWVYDFDEYITIPKEDEIDFTYLKI
jgi:hypothetical protein